MGTLLTEQQSTKSYVSRSKAFRDRRKESGIRYKLPKLSREQLKSGRLYNRMYKREYRKRLSEKQRDAVRQYDRSQHLKFVKVRQEKLQEAHVTFYTPLGPVALWQAAHRALEHFPQSPRTFAQVLQHVWTRKRKLLSSGNMPSKMKARKMDEDRDTSVKHTEEYENKRESDKNVRLESENLMGQLKYMKGRKDSKSHADIVAHIKDKYASLRRASRLLGIRWNQLQRACKFPYDTGDDIVDFYIKPDVSITLPDSNLQALDSLLKHCMLLTRNI